MEIRICGNDEEIRSCYAVISQLRPHLDEDSFVRRVLLQGAEAFMLAYLKDTRDKVVGVCGFRIVNNLGFGRILFVDDLVVDENERSKGLGKILFDWLITFGKENGCGRIHLDSAVHRVGAHKFYMDQHMAIASFHFSKEI